MSNLINSTLIFYPAIGSNDGINPMTDTQTYCVYENQRWNPLSGYTSTGLPTDRYMWSDITGKHKRTREHTKLLSRHWHWVSCWEKIYERQHKFK